MEFGLKGKIALVLGGGGGIGCAVATTLAREGVKVAVGDVNQEALERTVKAIHQAGGEVLPILWDLADLASIDGHVKAIESQFGPVDILFNNTGGPPPTPAAGQDPAQWSKFFQAMVLSVIAITDRVLPGMRKQQWGRILTSTSSGVIAPIPNLGFSNALRLSLVGWSKTLSREVAKDGITVNVILPGRIGTDRITSLDEQKARREGRTVAEVAAESTAAIPLGRYGTPQEYANVVTFLASTAASYLTGSTIRVDGGYVASI
jgi:3-oxoacyl-[acyl-carrier protein] reductase